MKKAFTSYPFIPECFYLIVFILFSPSVFSQSLLPQTEESLFQHLIEVNQEWEKQSLDLSFLQNKKSFKNDNERIQLHLQLVEKILRKSDVTKLTSQQIANRFHYLDVLNDYWKRGIFPINTFHNQRQPYFVDQQGTACAVGYLVKESGAQEIVDLIQKENNYAYIEELQKHYPELQNWAEQNGFTLDELTWIQPGYFPALQEYRAVGNDEGVAGKINVMKTNTVGDLLIMAGDFSAVDGVPANSIIAWDGEEWITFGNGVEGEIFAIDTKSDGTIYIGGDFVLNDDPNFSNIAYWDGTSWNGLQQGDMQGTVYALSKRNDLIVGGDFQSIDNQDISYLAKYDFSDQGWNDYSRIYNSETFMFDTVYHAFAVNGPVRSFEKVSNHLLIGGDFSQTAPQVNDTTINQLMIKNLVYWRNENWITGFSEGQNSTQTVYYGTDGKLYVGGSLNEQYDLGIYNAGLWSQGSFARLDTLEGENRIHGFVEFYNNIYAYGDIKAVPIIGTYSDGFVHIGGGELNSTWNGFGGRFDKSVRAAEVFKDEIYFAGDFADAHGTAVNGLAVSPFSGPASSTHDGIFEKNKIRVYNVENQLMVSYENLQKNANLHLFNLQGQVIKSINLTQGSQTLEIPLSRYAGGMYVYQVVNEQGKQSGKFNVY